MKAGYIDIEDIPQGNTGAFPYAKWDREIEAGEALEITDQLGGRAAPDATSVIHSAFRRMQIKLAVTRRKGRVFVYRAAEEPVVNA